MTTTDRPTTMDAASDVGQARPPVTLPCPWCDDRLVADLPLADSLHCAGCATTVDLAPDAPATAFAAVRPAA